MIRPNCLALGVLVFGTLMGAGAGAQQTQPRRIARPEARMLGIGGADYYHNRRIVHAPDDTAANIRFLQPLAARRGGERVLLANLLLYQELSDAAIQNLYPEASAVEAALAAAAESIRRSSLEQEQAAREVAPAEDPWAGFGEAINRVFEVQQAAHIRTSREIGRVYARLAAVTRVVEGLYFDAGSQPTLDPGSVGLKALPRDEIGYNYEGTFATHVGQQVEVTYSGDGPLTNVIVVTKVLTRPVRRAPDPRLAANAATIAEFGGDPEMFLQLVGSDQELRQVPKIQYTFVPRLNPGDVLNILLGDSDPRAVTSATLALRSDQGLLAERPIAGRAGESDEPVPGAVADDGEARAKAAETRLRMGRELERQKKPEAALRYYRELVRDFVGTPAAEEAGERLKALEE